MRRSRVLASVALTVAAVSLAGAGGNGTTVKASTVQPLTTLNVPPKILGLDVVSEPIDQLKGSKRPYVDAVGLYSLRTAALLQATLEVSRFSEDAKTTSPAFQQTVVGQIGSTVPKPFLVGGDTVWLTTGKRQSVAVWFEGRYLFILSTREDYTTPRALLRAVLEVKP